MSRIQHIAIVALAFLTLPGFTVEKIDKTLTSNYELPTGDQPGGQPTTERQAQDTLPMAKDALWDTLSKTMVTMNEKTATYTAIFPDNVQELTGQTIKISGFILPLESTEKFTHFLLSKRTPTCFFCPPGEPNEIIEVFAEKPTKWADDLVTYQGQMTLIQGADTGIFFQLKNAIPIISP